MHMEAYYNPIKSKGWDILIRFYLHEKNCNHRWWNRSYTVLRGLKHFDDVEITAIVSMADDGGSTGVLRDELGVFPPGDVRQCLLALSLHGEVVRSLMGYR